MDWRKAQGRLGVTVDGVAGAQTWAALLARIGAKPLGGMHLALGAAFAKHSGDYGVNTPLRVAHCLAQSSAETAGFTRMVESLNYSASGLLGTFGRHRISAADCQRLGRKDGEGALSEARQNQIADLVYGGAWGAANLGNTKAGDGARFKGRGTKQTTGRSNYSAFQSETGLKVLDNPEMLADPDAGTMAGLIFWSSKGCNQFADHDDVTGATKRVNGGTNGLPERIAALARAKAILL